MGQWKFTCYSFKDVRKILHKYDENKGISIHDCRKILTGIQDSIKEIAKFYMNDEELYDDWIQNIDDDIHLNPDMETVNYRLNEFYSFCDFMKIWLPLR